MARLAPEHALPAGRVDGAFEAHRRKRYSRELLSSPVVEPTTPVCLGLDVETTRRLIGYAPRDDLWRELDLARPRSPAPPTRG